MRVLPVRPNSFTISEEAFDAQLKPIPATVDLDLKVLTYRYLGLTSVGDALHMAHHVAKEAVAVVGGVRDLSATGSVTAGASVGGAAGAGGG